LIEIEREIRAILLMFPGLASRRPGPARGERKRRPGPSGGTSRNAWRIH